MVRKDYGLKSCRGRVLGFSGGYVAPALFTPLYGLPMASYGHPVLGCWPLTIHPLLSRLLIFGSVAAGLDRGCRLAALPYRPSRCPPSFRSKYPKGFKGDSVPLSETLVSAVRRERL